MPGINTGLIIIPLIWQTDSDNKIIAGRAKAESDWTNHRAPIDDVTLSRAAAAAAAAAARCDKTPVGVACYRYIQVGIHVIHVLSVKSEISLLDYIQGGSY